MIHGDTTITEKDSSFHFENEKWRGLLTSQTIPKSVKSYGFEVKITKCDNMDTLMLGVQTENRIIVYQNYGYIHDGNNILDVGSPFGISDTITCSLRKIESEGTRHQIMFEKNGRKIGCMYPDVKGAKLRLFMGVEPDSNKKCMVDIECRMGNHIYSLDFGMYTLKHP